MYTDVEYTSPSIIRNYITNPSFETTSGWIATGAHPKIDATKTLVESVYGRIGTDKKFISLLDDYLQGTYSEAYTYESLLKCDCGSTEDNKFILNSGLKDNRTMLNQIPENSEWVLDYSYYIVNVVDDKETLTEATRKDNDELDFSIGEYLYDQSTGGYS
jgi:hypothetical protein